MYPTSHSVTLSTNSSGEPVIVVSISQDSKYGNGKSLRLTSYCIESMLVKLRTSRQAISEFTSRETVCYPAGESDTLDDLIEELLHLGFMIRACGVPFRAPLFEERWGAIPYTCDRGTKWLVKESLSK